MATVHEQYAQAKALGLSDQDMMNNLDDRAKNLSERLLYAVTNGNLSEDGQIEKIAAEALTLRAFRREALGIVMGC